jgi:hypothetical protein
MTAKSVIFCNVTPYCLMGVYRRFGDAYFLHQDQRGSRPVFYILYVLEAYEYDRDYKGVTNF